MDDPTPYLTNGIGPVSGPLRDEGPDTLSPIGVIDEGDAAGLPRGLAYRVRRDAQGRALWAIKAHGAIVPGHHAIVDRRLILVDPTGEPPAWWRSEGR